MDTLIAGRDVVHADVGAELVHRADRPVDQIGAPGEPMLLPAQFAAVGLVVLIAAGGRDVGQQHLFDAARHRAGRGNCCTGRGCGTGTGGHVASVVAGAQDWSMRQIQDVSPAPTKPPAPPSTAFALGDSAADAQRRRDLTKMKVVATGCLVVAAIIYLFTRYLEHRDGHDVAAWWAMCARRVGGRDGGCLADWFAVTALFRHPLGLPIPHTALIRKKKDDIGDQLGGFIEDNFMTPAVIEHRAYTLELPRRLSTWVADPANSDRIADEVAQGFSLAAEMLRDEDIEGLITYAIKWAGEPQWAQPLGRVLEQLITEDRLEPVFQLACDKAHDWALGSQWLIDRIIDEDVGPSWKPKFVNTLLGDRIYRELVDFTYKVRAPTPDIRCVGRCTPSSATSLTICSTIRR